MEWIDDDGSVEGENLDISFVSGAAGFNSMIVMGGGELVSLLVYSRSHTSLPKTAFLELKHQGQSFIVELSLGQRHHRQTRTVATATSAGLVNYLSRCPFWIPMG